MVKNGNIELKITEVVILRKSIVKIYFCDKGLDDRICP